MINTARFSVGNIVQILPDIAKTALPDKMKAYAGVISRIDAIITDDLTDSTDSSSCYYLLDNNEFMWPERTLCAVFDPTSVTPRYRAGSLVDIIPYERPEWSLYLRLSWISNDTNRSRKNYIDVRSTVAEIDNENNLKQLQITKVKTFKNGGIGYLINDFSKFYIDERVLVSSSCPFKSKCFRTTIASRLYGEHDPQDRILLASKLKDILIDINNIHV